MPPEAILWSGIAGLTLENISVQPVRLVGGGTLHFTHPVVYHFEIERRQYSRAVPALVDRAAHASWQLRGTFEAHIERTGPWIEVRLSESDAAGAIHVDAPYSGCPDETVAAILGIHAWDSPDTAAIPHQQWITPDHTHATPVARLRKACLDRVSLACLQPEPRSGNQWLDTAGARALRTKLASLTPDAIAGALRLSGFIAIRRYAATEAGLAALKTDLAFPSAGPARAMAIPVRLPDAAPASIHFSAGCDGSITGYEDEGLLPAAHAAAEHALDLAARSVSRPVGIEAITSLRADAAERLIGGKLPTPREEIVELRISYQLKTDQFSAWSQLPSERTADYFPAISTLSIETQRALRKWAGGSLVADLDRMREIKDGPCYLFYRSSPPYRPKTRAAFSYDLLDATHVRALYRQTAASFKTAAPVIETQLTAAGSRDIGRHYNPRKIGALVEPVRGELPRALASLLSGEAEIIEALVRIATEMSASRRAGRKPVGRGRELTRAIQLGLRRAARGPALEWLTPILFAEATLALSSALGGSTECVRVLEIRHSGGSTIQTSRPPTDEQA